jgi:hypothetical protein
VRRAVAAGLLAAATLVLVLGPGAQPAAACSCPGPLSAVEAFAQADAVFAGRMVSQRLVERYREGAPQTTAVTFHVDEVWKGPVEPRLVVLTHAQPPACGYAFDRARRHLVYARFDAGELTTSACDRSAPLDQAEEDLAVLGASQDPGWVQPLTFARDRPIAAAATVLVVLVAVRLLVDARGWRRPGADSSPAG